MQFISRELKGVIVTLDETGYLHCAYLGTDPSMMVTPAPESRDINYEVSAVEWFYQSGQSQRKQETKIYEPITRQDQSNWANYKLNKGANRKQSKWANHYAKHIITAGSKPGEMGAMKWELVLVVPLIG